MKKKLTAFAAFALTFSQAIAMAEDIFIPGKPMVCTWYEHIVSLVERAFSML